MYRCEHTSSATVRSSGVVVQFSILSLLAGVLGGRAGHSWNDWQVGRRGPGQRRTATVQQELAFVDDPGTFCVRRWEK